MSNLRVTPFTEIVEAVQDLSRSPTSDEARIRGIVNRQYTQDIPRIMDFNWLKSSSALNCVAEVDSGVVLNCTTQDTVVTFSGVTIATDTSSRKIKFR